MPLGNLYDEFEIMMRPYLNNARADILKIYKPIMEKVIDEKTKQPIQKGQEGYTRGIVYISDDYVEYGWFKTSPDNIVVSLNTNMLVGRTIAIGISREALPGLIWSNKLGYYIPTKHLNSENILYHKLIKGQGNFPYQFPKRYEAAESFHIFKDAQTVLEDVKYTLSDHLKYTFGLEFETSMGYIPQEICFRDGLIPLRDGSISGIEYSTVVLEGNRGLNLLKQQLDTLKKYTVFNKECALHIHMGGFPVTPIHIFVLYTLWHYMETDLECEGYIPALSFRTAEYKNNQKDYCSKLPKVDTFESLYKLIVDKKFMGSLVQPHPADIGKRAKWNIKTRYFGLNLVNMLCYKGPKTVEFRFLRPSFNYRKITLWLYILNAVLKYAEHLATEWTKEGHCDTNGLFEWITKHRYRGIPYILSKVYSADICSSLSHELNLLRISVRNQASNGDYCGSNVELEDELFV